MYSLPSPVPLVLSVYYTRNSYTLSYTVDGKAHTSLTYKFGETVTPAAAPEKTGYTFSGWQGVPETMPANDVEASGTFTASTYYIAFDSNGGTGTMEKQRFTYAVHGVSSSSGMPLLFLSALYCA